MIRISIGRKVGTHLKMDFNANRPLELPSAPPNADAGAMASRADELHDFEAIYREQVEYVWRALASVGVPRDSLADASQDLFVIVHRRLGEFEGRSSIRTWLYGIARRLASRYRRHDFRERRRRDALAREVSHLSSHPNDHESLLQQTQLVLIERFLESLDTDTRSAFELCELQELTTSEAAEVLDLPATTIKGRLQRARAMFRDYCQSLHEAETALQVHRAQTRPSAAQRRQGWLALLAAISLPQTANAAPEPVTARPQTTSGLASTKILGLGTAAAVALALTGIAISAEAEETNVARQTEHLVPTLSQTEDAPAPVPEAVGATAPMAPSVERGTIAQTQKPSEPKTGTQTGRRSQRRQRSRATPVRPAKQRTQPPPANPSALGDELRRVQRLRTLDRRLQYTKLLEEAGAYFRSHPHGALAVEVAMLARIAACSNGTSPEHAGARPPSPYRTSRQTGPLARRVAQACKAPGHPPAQSAT